MLGGQVVAFLGVAALVTMTPGPDMALIAKHAFVGGRRAAWLASIGILTGLLGWALLSALGLVALLNASAPAFATLKLVGGAYLVFVGFQTLWQSRRREVAAASDLPPVDAGTTDFGAYRQGVLSNLLNPKVGVFYATLLPQFVSAGDPVLAKTVFLAFLHLLISIAWLAWYVRLVVKASDVLRRSRVRRWLDRATGAVLIALGLRLATERR